VLIFFMFRNGKKRQQAQQEMQNNLVPGAEVMLQSGIYATVESVDSEENRVTVRSGDSTLVVHRNAIGQIVAPAEVVSESAGLAPDDDPEFGERLNDAKDEPTQAVEEPFDAPETPADEPSSDAENTGDDEETPRA
jgi:preprotein translocase subunit YajC